MDPLGRQVALTLGAGRVALGIGALLVTGPTLKALGFGQTDGTGGRWRGSPAAATWRWDC